MQHSLVLMQHRWASDFRPSVVRTVCPVPSMTLTVPPTLVSFAVDVAKLQDVITPELKKAGNKLVWLRAPVISTICRITQDHGQYEKASQ